MTGQSETEVEEEGEVAVSAARELLQERRHREEEGEIAVSAARGLLQERRHMEEEGEMAVSAVRGLLQERRHREEEGEAAVSAARGLLQERRHREEEGEAAVRAARGLLQERRNREDNGEAAVSAARELLEEEPQPAETTAPAEGGCAASEAAVASNAETEPNEVSQLLSALAANVDDVLDLLRRCATPPPHAQAPPHPLRPPPLGQPCSAPLLTAAIAAGASAYPPSLRPCSRWVWSPLIATPRGSITSFGPTHLSASTSTRCTAA